MVLWSDHGYHLGEKEISGKNSLWTQSTRVPLIFAGPGIESGLTCNQPAELLDIYPTLCELAGLPAAPGLEGLSLRRQIQSPSTLRKRPAICTHNAGNHSVCDERWRYVVYADGSEELYDRRSDPHEFHNLIIGNEDRPEYRAAADRLAAWLPRDQRPLADHSGSRILEEREDGFYWEDKRIHPGEVIR